MSQGPRVALYIDPASPTFLRDGFFDSNGASHAGDHILAPYAYLWKFFNARNIPVHTADFLPAHADGTRNLYVSIGNPANYRKLSRRADLGFSGFFAIECPIVEASIYPALKR